MTVTKPKAGDRSIIANRYRELSAVKHPRSWGFAGIQFQPTASRHTGWLDKRLRIENRNALGGDAARWNLALIL